MQQQFNKIFIMTQSRKKSSFIMIAILFILHFYIGETAITCLQGQFLAPDIGSSYSGAGAQRPGCLDLKYFVYDAQFYNSGTPGTYTGTCAGTDFKIDLAGQIYRGCIQQTQLVYRCNGYSRTNNGAGHGIYACTGCPVLFKYIVTVQTAFNPLTVYNPFGFTAFKKTCTMILIPNCATYERYDFTSLYGRQGIGSTPTTQLYQGSYYAYCSSCGSFVTENSYNLNYYNDALGFPSTGLPASIGYACLNLNLKNNLTCSRYKILYDLQYSCDSCSGGTIFYYQSGTYKEKCIASASYPKYYDANCKTYDSFDATSATGKCVKCADGYELTTIYDSSTTYGPAGTRIACLNAATKQPLQPCSDIYRLSSAATFYCRGCPSGFTLLPITGTSPVDSTVIVGSCISNDRYLPVDNCFAITGKTSLTAATDGAMKCRACSNGGTIPYCTSFPNAIAVDSSKQQYGAKCTAASGDNGKREVASSFIRSDNYKAGSVFLCTNLVTIDACADYVSSVSISRNVVTASVSTPLNCQGCYSGYTLVQSNSGSIKICIKNTLVVKSCTVYSMATLACTTCLTGTVYNATLNKCMAFNDYTANCAAAVNDTATGKTRCISCFTNFTLIRSDDGYFCISSVLGCSNLTNDGICYGCASSSQQLVAGRLCITLPINCKTVGSDGICLVCNDGFIVNSATSNCDQIAGSGSNTQITCSEGQYQDSNGVCVIGSISNCAKFNVSANNIKCTQCKDGYHASNFGHQCDLDDPAQGGIKCQDKLGGDTYIWVESPWSGNCLKRDKRCGSQSHQDPDNHRIYCGTCVNGYYANQGLCYAYESNNTADTTNN